MKCSPPWCSEPKNIWTFPASTLGQQHFFKYASTAVELLICQTSRREYTKLHDSIVVHEGLINGIGVGDGRDLLMPFSEEHICSVCIDSMHNAI